MPFRFDPPFRLSAMAVCAALAVASVAHAGADTYRFDPVHSQVWFTTDHQGFSKPQGRARIKDGWFRFDPKDWSSAQVDVIVDLAGLDLGDAKWNAMVTSGQFLDAARWPTAHYTSRRVEATDSTHAIVHGELEFRGAKQAVDLAVTFNRAATDPYAFRHKAGFSATASLSRAAFGMTRYKDVVADEVRIDLQIEGIRDRDAATPSGEHADAEK
jgi:polyisoprenoid-binding protein YceI